MTSSVSLDFIDVVHPSGDVGVKTPSSIDLDLSTPTHDATEGGGYDAFEASGSLLKAHHESFPPKTLLEHLNAYRIGTAENPGWHQEARENPFIKRLIAADVCQNGVYKYLRNLLFIHSALENLQFLSDKNCVVVPFIDKCLYRSEIIRRDIEAWRVKYPPKDLGYVHAKATGEYCDYLATLALKGDQKLALAHMWVLYGTLLSGGQMVRRGIEKWLATKREEDSAQFVQTFTTGIPEDIAAFKQEWHKKLNSTLKHIEEGERAAFIERLCQETLKAHAVIRDFVRQDLVAC